jgi:hypothetical protein
MYSAVLPRHAGSFDAAPQARKLETGGTNSIAENTSTIIEIFELVSRDCMN